MRSKLKECAGAGGKSPHPAYIFKNIDGKKYCKSCSMYLTPPKPLAKVAKDKVIVKDKIDKQWDFFLKIWNERPHICGNCNKSLGSEPRSYHFDHLLEKSIYKDLKYVDENIFLICLECHNNKSNGFPGEKHKLAIEAFKAKCNSIT